MRIHREILVATVCLAAACFGCSSSSSSIRQADSGSLDSGGAGSGGIGGIGAGGIGPGGIGAGGIGPGGIGAGGIGAGGVNVGLGGTNRGGSTRTGVGGTGGRVTGGTGGTGGANTGGAIVVAAGGQAGFNGPGATVSGFLIPNDHPRLFWTADRLARAQTWWKKNAFTPDSDIYSLNEQLMAYMMTKNNTYCQQAINNALKVDLSDCTATKNGCDEARWYGESVILTYDWCYSVLSESQRTTLLNNWNKWLAAIQKQDWGGPGQSQSNYYFGNLRNEAEWGIATYQENQTSAEAFLKDSLVTRYANDFIPAGNAVGKGLGGLGLEGGQYGPYQSYYISSIVFPSIASGGRDIFNETPYWKGTLFNRIYMTPPQATQGTRRNGWDVFPFGDDEGWENGSPSLDYAVGTFMYAAANQWAGSNLGAWARRWINMVGALGDPWAMAADAGGASEDFTNLPLDYYNAGPRYLVGRSDWTTNATSYLFQMGDLYSTGHNHNDWGAFQINRKGRWLSRETVGYDTQVPGYGASGSQPIYAGIAHNVPLVNGAAGVTLQAFPGQGGDNYWMGPPVVQRLDSQASYVYADVDLTGVYHDSSLRDGNSAAQHVEREYWFFRDIETFVILDRLQTDTAARSRTFVVHCETNPKLVDDAHLLCINGDQQLSVTSLLPAKPSSRTVVDESKVSNPTPAQNVQYRVEINDAPNATLSYTLHVLQAMDASGTPLAPELADSAPSTPESGTLTVTLDAKHSLTITKGKTSTGGSVAINGQSSDLRKDVAAFTIGADNKPVWGP